MILFFIFWFVCSLIFIYVSSSLLLSLLVLELLTFFSLAFLGFIFSVFVMSEFHLLVFFSLFVMEGIIGLLGFIILVFHAGSDYLGGSSILSF